MRPVLPLLLLAALANAQPGPQNIDCLDTLVLNSDYAVVGRIVEIPERHAPTQTNVVIEIQERLKHGPGFSNTGEVEIQAPAATLEAWRKNKTPLLILKHGPGSAIDLDHLPRLVRSDLKPLTTVGAVLEEARQAIRRHPGVVRVETTYRYLPPDCVTSVPLDDEFRQWARKTLKSKAPTKERPIAASAMGYFLPDRGDVELMKSLLSDEEPTVMRSAEENRGWLVERFLTRDAAYRTLSAWDVKPPEPEMERKTFRPERVKYVFFWENPLPPEAMADVPKFSNLRDLYLQTSRLDAAHLAWVASLKNVRVLHLESSPITDADLAQLKGGLPNLETLIVQGTAITDASIDVIASFPKLKRVGIAGTKISPTAATRLHILRPDITLERKAQ